MGLIFSKDLDFDTVEHAQKTSLAVQRQEQEAKSFTFLEKKLNWHLQSLLNDYINHSCHKK